MQESNGGVTHIARFVIQIVSDRFDNDYSRLGVTPEAAVWSRSVLVQQNDVAAVFGSTPTATTRAAVKDRGAPTHVALAPSAARIRSPKLERPISLYIYIYSCIYVCVDGGDPYVSVPKTRCCSG